MKNMYFIAQQKFRISEKEMNRGVVRGGPLGHGPSLWVARIAKLHRKVSKIEALYPLCKLGIRLWARNHLILGEKWDEI